MDFTLIHFSLLILSFGFLFCDTFVSSLGNTFSFNLMRAVFIPSLNFQFHSMVSRGFRWISTQFSFCKGEKSLLASLRT